ncbi:hypothetical protein LPJ47_003659 [Vibrio parahaemolyticus]|nr:hypothetical protein [Vibrio parahaemolyticus]
MTNRGSRTDAEPERLDTEPVSCHTTSRAAQLKAAPNLVTNPSRSLRDATGMMNLKPEKST